MMRRVERNPQDSPLPRGRGAARRAAHALVVLGRKMARATHALAVSRRGAVSPILRSRGADRRARAALADVPVVEDSQHGGARPRSRSAALAASRDLLRSWIFLHCRVRRAAALALCLPAENAA